MFNGHVVPKQPTRNYEIDLVHECGVKNKLQRSQNNVNTIKTAISVRTPRSRRNLITIFYNVYMLSSNKKFHQSENIFITHATIKRNYNSFEVMITCTASKESKFYCTHLSTD